MPILLTLLIDVMLLFRAMMLLSLDYFATAPYLRHLVYFLPPLRAI